MEGSVVKHVRSSKQNRVYREENSEVSDNFDSDDSLKDPDYREVSVNGKKYSSEENIQVR